MIRMVEVNGVSEPVVVCDLCGGNIFKHGRALWGRKSIVGNRVNDTSGKPILVHEDCYQEHIKPEESITHRHYLDMDLSSFLLQVFHNHEAKGLRRASLEASL